MSIAIPSENFRKRLFSDAFSGVETQHLGKMS